MFVIVLSAVIGCQSYRSAVGIICNAPTTCNPCKQTTDVYQRRDLLAQHIDGQLKNEKARELLNSMTDMSPSLRSQTLASEAKRKGLKGCPLATELKD